MSVTSVFSASTDEAPSISEQPLSDRWLYLHDVPSHQLHLPANIADAVFFGDVSMIAW